MEWVIILWMDCGRKLLNFLSSSLAMHKHFFYLPEWLDLFLGGMEGCRIGIKSMDAFLWIGLRDKLTNSVLYMNYFSFKRYRGVWFSICELYARRILESGVAKEENVEGSSLRNHRVIHKRYVFFYFRASIFMSLTSYSLLQNGTSAKIIKI